MTDKGRILDYHHLTFWVGNAAQASTYYKVRMGFEDFAYKGLETGERQVVSHVVKQNKIIFEFQSPLNPASKEMGDHLVKHGDGVKDISFEVENIDDVFSWVKEGGAKIIRGIWEEEDDFGKVRFAKVQTFGDTTHTFIERCGYRGIFLPGYREPMVNDCLVKSLPIAGLEFLDHVAGNQEENGNAALAEWYTKNLKFHQFWAIDGDKMRMEHNSLRTRVMTDKEEKLKISMNEPEPGQLTSQIKEYVTYYGGPGVQHIALFTDDIISSVSNLKARGLEFLSIPDEYYTGLRERLAKSKVNVAEDIDKIQSLKIAVDLDDRGYLLQIFTRPAQDRPTLFYELIQRRNHQGFGQGNYKSLFEAIEHCQDERGNLHQKSN